MAEREQVSYSDSEYNPIEARGNVKILEEMFGKGGEYKETAHHPKEKHATVAPKISNVKPKVDTTVKKPKDEVNSKEDLHLQHKLDEIKQVLSMPEHPVAILNHLRQMFDLPPQYYASPEEHQPTQSSGNNMDIEVSNQKGSRDRKDQQPIADDLMMDDEINGLN